MSTPEQPQSVDPLLVEIGQADFFRLTRDGQLQQHERLSQLLADKTTASRLLRGMLKKFVDGTNHRSQPAEEAWGDNLLRVFELSASTPPQPELRATILAHFAQFICLRDQVYSQVGEGNAKRDFDAQLLARHQQIVERLANLPQAIAGPDVCALLLDHVVRNLNPAEPRPDGALPGREIRVSNYLGKFVRKQMAENYFGTEYSPLDFAEYGTDAACVAQTTAGRAAALHSSSPMILPPSKTGEFAFINKLQITGERYDADMMPAMAEALFDPNNPNSLQAERIIRKQLSRGYPANTFHSLIHCIELQGGKPLKQEYLDRATTLVKDVFGEAGVQAFTEFQKHSLTGADPRIDDAIAKRLTVLKRLTIARWQQPDGHLQRFRVVEAIEPTAMRADGVDMRELTELQRRGITDYVAALNLDIKESNVALGETRTELRLPGNETTWCVFTKPNQTKPFPACALHIVGDKELFTFQLNDDLNFDPALRTDLTPATQQALELCRSYAVAALHDQLSISHVTTVDRPVRPQPEKPQDTEPTIPKPPHVRRLKNLVVIAKGEQAEHTALSTAPDPVKPDDVRLMVDRKPHWQDLAPDLTRQARLNVLTDIDHEGLLSVCSIEQRLLLFEALAGKNAHLLSSRRILDELAQRRKSDGTAVLPDTLPLAELRQRFRSLDTNLADDTSEATTAPTTKTEEDYYYEQLQTQDALGEAATIRLPSIMPVLRRDKVTGEQRVYRPSIGQRIEADKIAMRDADVNYPVPPRRLPTQTYVPFHRMAAIPVHDRVTRKKKFTIIRADSAVKALAALVEEDSVVAPA